jgi:hypothetical protein
VLAAWCTGGSGQGERGGAQGGGTALLKAVFEGREYEGERCGARLGRLMREKCEVTLEVDESCRTAHNVNDMEVMDETATARHDTLSCRAKHDTRHDLALSMHRGRAKHVHR